MEKLEKNRTQFLWLVLLKSRLELSSLQGYSKTRLTTKLFTAPMRSEADSYYSEFTLRLYIVWCRRENTMKFHSLQRPITVDTGYIRPLYSSYNTRGIYPRTTVQNTMTIYAIGFNPPLPKGRGGDGSLLSPITFSTVEIG